MAQNFKWSACPLFGLLLSCSGGGTGGPNITLGQSIFSIHLVGGPGDGVESLSLSIQKVELNGAQGWTVIATPASAYSITTLVDGSSATLASGTSSLQPGAYTALRLTMGTGSTAQLVGGNALPLLSAAPVFVIPVNFNLTNSAVDLTLIVDPGRSVQPQGNTLLFTPEFRVVDRNLSGGIVGKFSDAAGPPISGALVTAQTFQALGEPVILRRVLTHADGSYALDLLPYGVASYAVCFPQASGKVYEPKASAAFTPQAGAAMATFNTNFITRSDLASTSGKMIPSASAAQGDEIKLLFGAIQAGATPQMFIIGTSPGIQAGSAETYGFQKLPAGSTYQIRPTRRTWSADGAFVPITKFSDDLGFLANTNTPWDFSF